MRSCWQANTDRVAADWWPVDGKMRVSHRFKRSEKELDTDYVFEVEGESSLNFIPLAVVIEHIKLATGRERAQVKNALVKIDFANGDPMHFFGYLAKAIAI